MIFSVVYYLLLPIAVAYFTNLFNSKLRDVVNFGLVRTPGRQACIDGGELLRGQRHRARRKSYYCYC